jgi:hypothetical protein
VQIVAELTSVGEQYDAGIPLPLKEQIQSSFSVPTPVNWLEFDRATRFAATLIPGFSWPTTWAMKPTSDPTIIMTQRVPLVAENVTSDPFFAEVWAPLYALAVPYYDYLITMAREQPPSSIPYDDASALALQLLDLMATAVELTAYLETL